MVNRQVRQFYIDNASRFPQYGVEPDCYDAYSVG